MKKGRFGEEQIIGVLKQHEAGRKVPDLAREIGVSEATIYTWKSKYGGMDVSEAQRLKRLEEENRRLKHLVADLSLDKEALKGIVRKNGWSFHEKADGVNLFFVSTHSRWYSRRSRPSYRHSFGTARSRPGRILEAAAANPCRRAPFW
jgi:putative transposase